MSTPKPRLVVIHGVCAGMGQSTLFEGLRTLDLVPRADYLEEDTEPSVRHAGYPAHFDRPEFAEVAERFLRHNADRTAGVGHPPARMLEAFWQRLVDDARTAGRSIISGLSFIDLAEDLDWAMASEAALHDHSRAVLQIVAPLEPVMLELEGDVAIALARAARQRGWDDERTPQVDECERRAARLDRALDAGGWPRRRIDATSQTAERVRDAAIDILHDEGVVVSRRADR